MTKQIKINSFQRKVLDFRISAIHTGTWYGHRETLTSQMAIIT